MKISVYSLILLALVGLIAGAGHTEEDIALENSHFRYEISSDAMNSSFFDKVSGRNWLSGGPAAYVQISKSDAVKQPATSAVFDQDTISYAFGDTGITARVKVETYDDYISLSLVELSDPSIYRIDFVSIVFTLSGTTADPFAACGLACNLSARVEGLPGHTSGILASAYPHLGWQGAKVAIAAALTTGYRDLLKKVVSDCGVEYSPMGGPWALDFEINRGSYIIDYSGSVGEQTVDKWIDLAHAVGAKQIDFHAGPSIRFGDYMPRPEAYPSGLDGLKSVVDKMRSNGLSAGLHTYSQFIAKDSPWVTPVPDPRLAKIRSFTLAADIEADATEIPLNEPTSELSITTGFFLVNSLTMQIGDELITFSGFTTDSPYKLTGCQRGAFGTKAASHTSGAKIQQLKEMFHLFVPDARTDLMEEIARRTAEVYNYCGFEMIYLDALDGSWCCGDDRDDAWYLESRFVWELNRHLERPPVMEMSTFHHHLWPIRSRSGAFDSPLKAYKTFKDRHLEIIKTAAHYMLPTNFGWFSAHPVYLDDGLQPQRIFMDDIEYLCVRALATDSSLSYLLGFKPELYEKYYNTRRICATIRQYEELRLSRYFSSDVLEKLLEPGREFKLQGSSEDGWSLRPVDYVQQLIHAENDQSRHWQVENKYEDQPVKLRIEALKSLESGDSPDAVTLAKPGDVRALGSAAGVVGSVQEAPDGSDSAIHLRAMSENDDSKASWFRAGHSLDPHFNAYNRGIAVTVRGDGSGALLCIRMTNPEHISNGSHDHLIRLDFTGERSFSLVEPEGDACAPYKWPGPHIYSYENWVSYPQIDGIQFFLHDLPKETEVNCFISDVRSVPLAGSVTRNPSVTINGERITFLTTMKSGYYIELTTDGVSKLYDEDGTFLREVKALGKIPTLRAGTNSVSFLCRHIEGGEPRYRVVVESWDQPLGR